MLYQIHELQRAFMHPLSQWAQATSQLYTNPYSPLAYTPLSKRIAASLDLTHRIGKAYEKPEWKISQVETPEGTAQVTVQTDIERPFCRLVHFEKTLTATQKAMKNPGHKVLVVAPMSGHHATLLRDTVRRLLADHDVYITDWIDARMVPLIEGGFHLHDYVYYVRDFIRALGPGVNVISVCQPTVPVLAAVSLMASSDEPVQPQTMIMMGGPIDPRECPTAVNNLATKNSFKWFERNMIYTVPQRYPGYLRKVYPGFLQYAGFIAMNPSRHATSHYDYFEHLIIGEEQSAEAHREFYDEYNAVLDLSADFYLETIRTVFQEHLLPRGLWDVKGSRVRPQDVRKTALLTIEGELDDISGIGQTKAAHKLCTGIAPERHEHYEVPGAGHYGIFSGKRWRTLVAPKITEFIQKHGQSSAPSASPGRTARVGGAAKRKSNGA